METKCNVMPFFKGGGETFCCTNYFQNACTVLKSEIMCGYFSDTLPGVVGVEMCPFDGED